jgi:hypothetical protein
LATEPQELLSLDPTAGEYELVGGPYARHKRQIVLQTFSLMQIMAAVAARVDIPQKDIEARCAIPVMADVSPQGLPGKIAIRSSEQRPAKAFAKVNFHGHWFWVEDHNLAAKRVFSFLMLAFTMMENTETAQPLQLTIPVQ